MSAQDFQSIAQESAGSQENPEAPRSQTRSSVPVPNAPMNSVTEE